MSAERERPKPASSEAGLSIFGNGNDSSDPTHVVIQTYQSQLKYFLQIDSMSTSVIANVFPSDGGERRCG